MVAGLWILRKQRRKNNVPVTAHRAWDSAVILRLAWIVLLLVMPWYVTFYEISFMLFMLIILAGYPPKMVTVTFPSGMQREWNISTWTVD